MKIYAIKIAEFPGIISWSVPKSIDGERGAIGTSLLEEKGIFCILLYGKTSAQLYFKANMLLREPEILCV